MKKYIKILSIILSIIIIFNSFLNCTFIVYASEGVYPSGTSKLEKVLTEASSYLVYLATRVGAIVDGDFAKWVQNREDYIQWWNTGHISYDEKTDSVLFDKDLVNYIKQALKEYAEETNGFIVLPSVHFSTLSTSTFSSSYQYQTVKALVNEYGLISVSTYANGEVMIRDFSEYLSNNAGFYILSDMSSYYSIAYEDLLTWARIYYANDVVNMKYFCEKVIHSWDEGKSSASSADGLYYYSSPDRLALYGNIYISKQGYFMGRSDSELVSKDGRNILVFKSKEALESYSVDHRTVYFGSKFHEDTGTVTGSWDDFQDWLDGKYDDLWDRLKELIPSGSTLSEEELEKIIDKLLDQLDEIGDKVEEGNKETNNLLQQILAALDNLDKTMSSALSGVKFDTSGIEKYLSSILDSLGSIKNDLDDILDKLDEVAEDEVDNKSDALVEELSVPFSEVVDVLKTKFPFSLPDDIKGLFVVLNGGKEPGLDSLNERLESYSQNAYSDSDADSNTDAKIFDLIVYSDWNFDGNFNDNIAPASYMNLDSDLYPDLDDGIVTYAHEENPEPGSKPESETVYISMDKYGAPIFRFPLVIKSYGFKSELVISMSRFRSVANLSRRLFTLIFLQQLMLLSIKIFDFMKGMIE